MVDAEKLDACITRVLDGIQALDHYSPTDPYLKAELLGNVFVLQEWCRFILNNVLHISEVDILNHQVIDGLASKYDWIKDFVCIYEMSLSLTMPASPL